MARSRSSININTPYIGSCNSVIYINFYKKNVMGKECFVGYIPGFIYSDLSMSNKIAEYVIKTCSSVGRNKYSIIVKIPIKFSYIIENPSRLSDVRTTRRSGSVFDMIRFDNMIFVNGCIFSNSKESEKQSFILGNVTKMTICMSEVISFDESVHTESAFCMNGIIDEKLQKNKFFKEYYNKILSNSPSTREIISGSIFLSMRNNEDMKKNIYDSPYSYAMAPENSTPVIASKIFSEKEIMNAFECTMDIDEYLYKSSERKSTVNPENGKKVYFKTYNRCFNSRNKEHIKKAYKCSRMFLESDMIITDFD